MKNIYLIRHGEALHNIGHNKNGEKAYTNIIYTDSNITENGIKQCLKTRNYISDKFDKIFKTGDYIILVSPLKRCITTSLVILDKCKIEKDKFICIDEIREFPSGLHTPNKRCSKDTLEYFYGDRIHFKLDTNSDTYWKHDRLETTEELKKRVNDVKDYLNRLETNNIFIISHASFISYFLYDTTNVSIKHCKIYEYS